MTVAKTPRTRTKPNEEVIREELRATSDAYMKVWQAGMTLLPALMIALFYFRKEMVERFVLLGKIKSGELLPVDIYLIGTAFLLMVCTAFCLILKVVGNRYRFYSVLLNKECDNPLPLPPPSRWGIGRYLFYVTLLAFPFIDIALFFIYQWRVQIDFVASIVAR